MAAYCTRLPPSGQARLAAMTVKGLAALRLGEWWEHKLAPMLGTAYATAYLVNTSLLKAAPILLLTLASIAVGGAYVSVVNDLTDLESDRQAGKPNRLADQPRWLAVGAIAAFVGAGIAIGAVAWRNDLAALVIYGAAWVSFSLYSIPPFRFKARSWAGVLSDACGAHLFPYLLMALVVFREAHHPVILWWMALVGAWTLAVGVRGALLHQLGDVEADRRAGVRAFGALHPKLAHDIGLRVAFPIELLALAGLLAGAHNVLAIALLPVYVLVERHRQLVNGRAVSFVTPSPRRRVAMQTYYAALFPLAFLIAASIRRPIDLIVLAAHVAVFRQELVGIVRISFTPRFRGIPADTVGTPPDA